MSVTASKERAVIMTRNVQVIFDPVFWQTEVPLRMGYLDKLHALPPQVELGVAQAVSSMVARNDGRA